MIFWEIVVGILGGIIGGMGMGGGTLTIPLLTIFLSFPQLLAQEINLIAFLPMSMVALFVHIKNKLVQFKAAWLLALVGCFFSLFGAIIANHMTNHDLKKLFAIFLIVLAVWQFCLFVKEQKDKKETQRQEQRKKEIIRDRILTTSTPIDSIKMRRD